MEILVASGGSPHSQLAIAYAVQLASVTDSRLTLLCVAPDGGEPDCDAVLTRAAQLGETLSGFTTKVRHGQPAEEVLRETEERDYDMIVVGEKGHHTPMTRFLLGPVAERIANRARIPVLVVKGDLGAEPPAAIRRMLVAVSLHGQDRAVRLLKALAPLAEATGAEVTVLHVMSQLPIPPTGTPDDWQLTAEELVAENTAEGETIEYDTEYLAHVGIPVKAVVRHGVVVDEVLAESEDGDYDLVVIGGHEADDWLHNLLLENVALDILHRVRRPVLTVHGQ